MDVSTWGQLTFFVYLANFGMVTKKQPGDPRASRLLSSEKAVYCKRDNRGTRIKHITRDILKEIMQRNLRKEHERDPGQLNESTEVLWSLAGS